MLGFQSLSPRGLKLHLNVETNLLSQAARPFLPLQKEHKKNINSLTQSWKWKVASSVEERSSKRPSSTFMERESECTLVTHPPSASHTPSAGTEGAGPAEER